MWTAVVHVDQQPQADRTGLGGGEARAELTVVDNGDQVVKGDLVLVLEAMKMEQPLTAHKDGTISGINTTVGATVSSGHLLLNIL